MIFPIQNDHAALVDFILEGLDGADMAAESNKATYACLRPQDALELARQVCLNALRTPGQQYMIDGIRALFLNNALLLGYGSKHLGFPLNPSDQSALSDSSLHS